MDIISFLLLALIVSFLIYQGVSLYKDIKKKLKKEKSDGEKTDEKKFKS